MAQIFSGLCQLDILPHVFCSSNAIVAYTASPNTTELLQIYKLKFLKPIATPKRKYNKKSLHQKKTRL